jgi:hypothetical protein
MASVAKQCKVPLLLGLAWTACIAHFAEMLRDELPRVGFVLTCSTPGRELRKRGRSKAGPER